MGINLLHEVLDVKSISGYFDRWSIMSKIYELFGNGPNNQYGLSAKNV